MSSCPKKRTSKSKRDMRRAHDFLLRTHAVICPSCGDPMLRHRVCASCGQYRGKALVQTASASEAQ